MAKDKAKKGKEDKKKHSKDKKHKDKDKKHKEKKHKDKEKKHKDKEKKHKDKDKKHRDKDKKHKDKDKKHEGKDKKKHHDKDKRHRDKEEKHRGGSKDRASRERHHDRSASTRSAASAKRRSDDDVKNKNTRDGRELEALLNRSFNGEFQTSYRLLSASCHFSRSGVALPGFARYFRHKSERHHRSAKRIILHMLRADRAPTFSSVPAPSTSSSRSSTGPTPLEAARAALEDVSSLRESAERAHEAAGRAGDLACQRFLSRELLPFYSAEEKGYADMISRLERVGPRLGLHIVDHELVQTMHG